MRKLILLGASGNIGEQTLTVLKKNKDLELVAFSVGNQTNKIKQIVKDHPHVMAICVKEADKKLFKQYPNIKFYVGDEGLEKIINETPADIVLNALVGFVGLRPTLAAFKCDMDLALANKESLVVGGELVMKALRHSKSQLYPVDSEHSAIYKCLKMCKERDVDEVLITASGGALRHLSRSGLKKVTPKQALKHPTWKMGPKVTIDSATMLNKGFEIIEAYYLFNLSIKQIKVLMHDESYVHSIVHLKDGSYLGEVNAPNMMNPIAYALKEDHTAEDVKHVNDLKEFGAFHFHDFDEARYPMVTYAITALKAKGTMPCVLNAVDEVVVDLFLKNQITFLDMEHVIKLALKTFKNHKHPSLETLMRVDKEAREWAKAAAILEGSI